MSNSPTFESILIGVGLSDDVSMRESSAVCLADETLGCRELFVCNWENTQPLGLSCAYKPNYSFYNSIDFFIQGLQVIIWPDADAKTAYSNIDHTSLEQYLREILQANQDFFNGATYVIGFIWNNDGDRMADLWKFTANEFDDRSGPTCEVRVFRNQVVCHDAGSGSGNTVLVLGAEEDLRRRSRSTQAYLDGPPPNLPCQLHTKGDFF